MRDGRKGKDGAYRTTWTLMQGVFEQSALVPVLWSQVRGTVIVPHILLETLKTRREAL